MNRFHAYLHPCPASAPQGDSIDVEGRAVLTLDLSPTEIAKQSFPLTFEAAFDNLSAIPRMFIEADGFFVWASERSADDWQISGHLYDREQRLSHVELHGSCPRAELCKLVQCFQLPEVELAVQLVRQGVYVSYDQFLVTMSD